MYLKEASVDFVKGWFDKGNVVVLYTPVNLESISNCARFMDFAKIAI